MYARQQPYIVTGARCAFSFISEFPKSSQRSNTRSTNFALCSKYQLINTSDSFLFFCNAVASARFSVASNNIIGVATKHVSSRSSSLGTHDFEPRDDSADYARILHACSSVHAHKCSQPFVYNRASSSYCSVP
uniref:Uncharacterized protein n=1 Tax=Trichogramma kaykai TaxID=54128 RepID=A0ABD2WTW4_9HYME